MRTILSFVKDGFRISKIHNEEFGGMTYSELPEDVQTEFLKYELSVDLLLDLPDRDILDIFARLNTYSVSLNKQELFNAKYFWDILSNWSINLVVIIYFWNRK